MAPIDDQIAELEGILNRGANSVTTDGVNIAYNLDQVRTRLEELKREKYASTRPRISSINLSNT